MIRKNNTRAYLQVSMYFPYDCDKKRFHLHWKDTERQILEDYERTLSDKKKDNERHLMT